MTKIALNIFIFLSALPQFELVVVNRDQFQMNISNENLQSLTANNFSHIKTFI